MTTKKIYDTIRSSPFTINHLLMTSMSSQIDRHSVSDEVEGGVNEAEPDAQTTAQSGGSRAKTESSSSSWDVVVIGGLFVAYVTALIAISVVRAVKWPLQYVWSKAT